jgi:hypothetical protein
MNLVGATSEFVRWGSRVLRVFFRIRPWTTTGVILGTTVAGITRLLSLLLPIKVILLAASSGVPRYFSFIEPAQKSGWLIALAGGCFAFYALTLLLDGVTRRWSEGASADVLEGANEMAIQSDQHERVQLAYSGFCGAAASALLILIGGGALLAMNPLLFGVLMALILAQFVVTSGIVRGDDAGAAMGPVKRWITEQSATYLSILGTIDTLFGFLVIVLTFVFGQGMNVLIAILSFLLVRRVVGAVRDLAGNAVRLFGRREQIDALVFPDAKRAINERAFLRDLRGTFSWQGRQELAQSAVQEALGPVGGVEATWVDPPGRFLHTVRIRVDAPPEGAPSRRFLQMQIYRSARRMYLENECFLFRHVDPAALHAPARLGRWTADPFEYQLLDYGQGRPMTGGEWKAHRDTLIAATLVCEPPEPLVRAYQRSHRLMPERLLDDRLPDRLDVAVDTRSEQEWLEAFRAGVRQELAQALRALPLTLDTRDLAPAACGMTPDDRPLAMIWGRWSLEPFGAGRLVQQEKIDPAAWLPTLAERRPALAGPRVTPDRLELARLCVLLEAADTAGNYKAALHRVGDIVTRLSAQSEPSSLVRAG